MGRNFYTINPAPENKDIDFIVKIYIMDIERGRIIYGFLHFYFKISTKMKKNNYNNKIMNIYKLQTAIQYSIKQFNMKGVGSNQKVSLLHKSISEMIKEKINNKSYSCHSLPEKEIKVSGRYYDKKVDICIKNNNIINGVVSIKFPMSNYLQNKNNYFEQLVGELTNINNLTQGIKQWFILIIFDNIPYYNTKREIVKYQNMKHEDMETYKKLLDDKILDNLSIITVSNGKMLNHPERITDYDSIDYTAFKIDNVYPIQFDETLNDFVSKLNKNEN